MSQLITSYLAPPSTPGRSPASHRSNSSSSSASGCCVVCLVDTPNTLLPCGHSVLCISCADGILAAPFPLCPLCRVRVVDFQVLTDRLCSKPKKRQQQQQAQQQQHLAYHKEASPQAQEAKEQYTRAMNLLFDNNETLYENAAEAFLLFEESAMFGFPYSQLMMALLYKNGLGCEADEKASVKWLKKAADQNLGMAMVLLGRWYATSQKPSKMIKFYKKAAATERGTAQAAFGYCLFTGNGISQDFRRAKDLFIAAANTGSQAKCLYYLGIMNFCGLGIDQPDFGEAFRHFLQAGKADDATAQHWLSRFYRFGYGVQRDKRLSLDWLVKAANGGHPAAQNELGCRWMAGDGVPKDVAAGLQWIQKAAAKKNVCATFVLATYCATSGQEDHDPSSEEPPPFTHKSLAKGYHERAKKLLKRSRHMLEMAESLEFGEGCEVDLEAAKRWYLEAAADGSPYAGFALRRLSASTLIEKPPRKPKSKRFHHRDDPAGRCNLY